MPTMLTVFDSLQRSRVLMPTYNDVLIAYVTFGNDATRDVRQSLMTPLLCRGNCRVFRTTRWPLYRASTATNIVDRH